MPKFLYSFSMLSVLMIKRSRRLTVCPVEENHDYIRTKKFAVRNGISLPEPDTESHNEWSRANPAEHTRTSRGQDGGAGLPTLSSLPPKKIWTTHARRACARARWGHATRAPQWRLAALQGVDISESGERERVMRVWCPPTSRPRGVPFTIRSSCSSI